MADAATADANMAAALKELEDLKVAQRESDDLVAALSGKAQALEQLTAEQAESIATLRTSAAHSAALMRSVWPSSLTSARLSHYENLLLDAIADGSATSTAQLLFAAIHTLSAARTDSDTRLLHDALREVGRRLLSWLKDQGLGDQKCLEVAGIWATELNSQHVGRAEVELPALGAPATTQWMLFRPKSGANSPDVVGVQTWCIRNAQGQVVHRAEVSV